MRTDDLTPLFPPPGDEPDVDYRQGRLVNYDPQTGENTVRVAGSMLTDLPLLSGIEATSLAPGMVVGLLRIRSQYFILGRVVVPDSAAIVVQNLDVNGAIRARLGPNLAGVVFGRLRSAATGEPTGHGLLVQADEAGDRVDIFRARESVGGVRGVYVGEAGAFADEFIVGADVVSLVNDEGRAVALTGTDVQLNITRTTGSSANVNLSGSSGAGALARVSSSRRYKTDIADHRTDTAAILQLRPRSWRDRGEVADNPDTTNRYVGLVAEEVHDAGLMEFVTYNEAGEPDAVAYDRLAVGLLDVVRAQQAQIAALTAWAASRGFTPPDRPEKPRSAVLAVPAGRLAPIPTPQPKETPDARHTDLPDPLPGPERRT